MIVKLQLKKTKMQILVKLRLLKDKDFVIYEDKADNIAKRLKELKKNLWKAHSPQRGKLNRNTVVT